MNRYFTARNVAIAGLIVINVATSSMLVHLMFFAGKGARFTASDGAQERQERITSDLALAKRLDVLHALLEDRCACQ